MPRRGDPDVEVEALYDGCELYVGGVVEDIGVGRAWALPPVTLGRADVVRLRECTRALADRCGVRGPVHVRFALVAGVPQVVRLTPGAGRGVPFVSRVTGVPLGRAGARVALGSTIGDLRAEGLLAAHGDGGVLPPDAPVAVRVVADGGEVVGLGATLGVAYARARDALDPLPTGGTVFVAVADRDRRAVIFPLKALAEAGFRVLAGSATAEVLSRHGVPAAVGGPVGAELVVDTRDGVRVPAGTPWVTTVRGLATTVQGIEAVRRRGPVRAPAR